MSKKYPKSIIEKIKSYHYDECDKCHGMIGIGVKIKRETIQHSIFRGDDEVKIYHEQCPEAK